MKPPPFDYFAAHDLEEALEPLAEGGGDALVLAGGQTLLPLLAYRLAAPTLLVDINGVAALQGISRVGDGVRIGAMTRQATILRDPIIAAQTPGLAMAARFVGHTQTRARGTLGGSLSFAEPAAEFPATALALGARMEVRSRDGARTLEADEFFLGPYTTAMAPDEIMTSVTFPDWGPDARVVVHEVARRSGDFALVGLVMASRVEAGKVVRTAISWFGMGPTPLRSLQAEQAMTGQAVSDLDFAALAELAVADTDPPDDIQASAHYRRTVARRIFPRLARQTLEAVG